MLKFYDKDEILSKVNKVIIDRTFILDVIYCYKGPN